MGTIILAGTDYHTPAATNSMYFEGTQTLDNATVTMGSPTDYTSYIYNDDTTDTGSVLTLGTNLIIDDNAGGNSYLDSIGSNFTGDGIWATHFTELNDSAEVMLLKEPLKIAVTNHFKDILASSKESVTPFKEK